MLSWYLISNFFFCLILIILTYLCKSILDKNQCSATFICFDMEKSSSANKPYQLKFNENNNTISLNYYGNEEIIDNPSINWLKNVLFPKFIKWSNEELNENRTKTVNIQSLSQINIEVYNELYNHLKEKYGTHLVKVCFFYVLLLIRNIMFCFICK